MIDTHCHIDLFDDPMQVAMATENKQIMTIAVSYLPSHYILACQHLNGFKHIHPALGLHPLAVKDHQREIPMFLQYAPLADYIGEVGLDFSGANKETKLVQERSFNIVVSQIKQTAKCVTIHSRGAEDAVLAILHNGRAGPVIFHWFSGSKNQLTRILDAGHRISLNTSMTSTVKWNDLIKHIPQTSILTETDGPFVKINRQPAMPSNVEIVLIWLAEKWGISLDEVAQRIDDNFKDFSADLAVNTNRNGPPT
jgi:TatD DNase family protein